MSVFASSTFRMIEGIDYSRPAVRWDGAVYIIMFSDYRNTHEITVGMNIYRSVEDACRHLEDEFTGYVEGEIAGAPADAPVYTFFDGSAICRCGNRKFRAEIVARRLA